jgi:cation:H+ antiporter
VTIAVIFVLNQRARAGLSAMISDKINQWTLLVGMLPIAMSVGAGALTSLPLDARQHEEFLLTAAQSLFGLALLLRLRLGLAGAAALFVLFATQIGIAMAWQAQPEREIAALTGMAWLYMALAAGVFAATGRRLAALVRAALGRAPVAS